MQNQLEAHDSYMLMAYLCRKCNHREQIWNGRDGVSPFCVNCSKCDGTMSHVDWNKDVRDPDYCPPKGSRYFADFTPPRALEAAAARVKSLDGTEFALTMPVSDCAAATLRTHDD